MKQPMRFVQCLESTSNEEFVRSFVLLKDSTKKKMETFLKTVNISRKKNDPFLWERLDQNFPIAAKELRGNEGSIYCSRKETGNSRKIRLLQNIRLSWFFPKLIKTNKPKNGCSRWKFWAIINYIDPEIQSFGTPMLMGSG